MFVIQINTLRMKKQKHIFKIKHHYQQVDFNRRHHHRVKPKKGIEIDFQYFLAMLEFDVCCLSRYKPSNFQPSSTLILYVVVAIISRSLYMDHLKNLFFIVIDITSVDLLRP